MGPGAVGAIDERFVADRRCFHVKRLENPGFHKFRVRLSRCFFNHRFDQAENTVLVGVTFSGRTNVGQLAVLFPDSIDGDSILDQVVIGMGHQAGALSQQVADAHLPAISVDPEFRHILVDRIIPSKLSLRDQDASQPCCKCF